MDPIILGTAIFSIVFGLLLSMRFKPIMIKVGQDEVLVVNRAVDLPILGPKGSTVFFDNAYVIKAFDSWEKMTTSARTIQIERKYNNPLLTKDGKEVSLKAYFQLQVAEDEASVLSVAKNIGCERASEESTLRELFEPKFSEALEASAGKMNARDIIARREDFRDRIIEVIGLDLDGFELKDTAIKDLKIA